MTVYRPPFFSERVGEIHINGCTIAASCMALASWTLGELTPPPTSSQLERRRFREDLEPGPVDQTRGWNPLDFDGELHKKFADLDLPPIPSWDNSRARLRIDFKEWKRRLIADECGTLAGNVGKVRDPGSPLHRFVNPVGHAIYVEASTDPDFAHVMDPMGLPADTYNGDRVSWDDLEQFASEYSGAGFMFVSLVPKGAQSTVSLNSQIASLTKNLKSCNTARTAAEGKAAAALKQATDLRAIVVDLNKLVEDLKKQIAAGAPPENFTPGMLCDVRDGAVIFVKPNGPELGIVTPPLTRFAVSTNLDGTFTRISSILDGNPRTVWIGTGDVDNVRPIPPEPNCDADVAAALLPWQTYGASVRALAQPGDQA